MTFQFMWYRLMFNKGLKEIKYPRDITGMNRVLYNVILTSLLPYEEFHRVREVMLRTSSINNLDLKLIKWPCSIL